MWGLVRPKHWSNAVLEIAQCDHLAELPELAAVAGRRLTRVVDFMTVNYDCAAWVRVNAEVYDNRVVGKTLQECGPQRRNNPWENHQDLVHDSVQARRDYPKKVVD